MFCNYILTHGLNEMPHFCQSSYSIAECGDAEMVSKQINGSLPPSAFYLDRQHGTPMLLEGVRCIGVELEYDSEQSDWQGFD